MSSKNKIEKALGMKDIKDLDDIDDFNEDDAKKKAEERKIIVQETKDKLENLKKNSGTDEDFIREMYKNIINTGATMLKVIEEEVQIDVKARNIETAAEMMNAVSTALDKLQSIGQHKDKMDIEKEKLEIKKNANQTGPTITANIVAAGSMVDLLKSFKKEGIEIGKVDSANIEEPTKTIDVKADIQKEEE